MSDPGSSKVITDVIDSLRSQILRLGGGGMSGQELLSDVICACLEHPEYDWGHPQIQGRVLRIAKNRRQDGRRRSSVRRWHSLTVEVQSGHSSEAEIIAADLLDVVEMKLGHGESELLRLIAIEGWDLQEVATRCGVSLDAMRSHWYRLRVRLQTLLGRACLAS